MTLGQVTEYETQFDTKVTAENRYATNMTTLLQSAASREEYNNQVAIIQRQDQVFASQVVSSSGKIQPKDVTDFGLNVITQIAAARTAADALEQQYSNALPASLMSISAHANSLGPVKSDLAQLQANQSNADQVKEWVQFAIQVRDKVNAKAAQSTTAGN